MRGKCVLSKMSFFEGVKWVILGLKNRKKGVKMVDLRPGRGEKDPKKTRKGIEKG